MVRRKANLVVAGGLVSGTWVAKDDELLVTWFAEAGRVPSKALAEEAERLGHVLGRSRKLRVRTA